MGCAPSVLQLAKPSLFSLRSQRLCQGRAGTFHTHTCSPQRRRPPPWKGRVQRSGSQSSAERCAQTPSACRAFSRSQRASSRLPRLGYLAAEAAVPLGQLGTVSTACGRVCPSARLPKRRPTEDEPAGTTGPQVAPHKRPRPGANPRRISPAFPLSRFEATRVRCRRVLDGRSASGLRGGSAASGGRGRRRRRRLAVLAGIYRTLNHRVYRYVPCVAGVAVWVGEEGEEEEEDGRKTG